MQLSEVRLWGFLQKRQLEGRKFRRQHSIGEFIVDFYCPSENLIIELDGSIHNIGSVMDYDKEREVFLQGLGFKILRIKAIDLLNYPELVLEEIKSNFTDSNTKNEA